MIQLVIHVLAVLSKVDIKIHIYTLMYNITLSFVPHCTVGLFCTFCRPCCKEQISHLEWGNCVSHVKNRLSLYKYQSGRSWAFPLQSLLPAEPQTEKIALAKNMMRKQNTTLQSRYFFKLIICKQDSPPPCPTVFTS